jgi:heme-degrading monooxygenase HmoA
MELPEDIRRKIEESHDRDTVRDVVSRLQSEGVTITHDVLAAIEATIAMTQGIVE